MTDLSRTIAPKSDQLNADDLISGPMTIKVSRVALTAEADQPISIYFVGDGGKPYKPCKSMRRVLVKIWGTDGAAYAGRRMTLYRDDKVQFGGMAVGGIRISHMSTISEDVTMVLTATRATRRPFTVKPLPEERELYSSQAAGRQEGELDRNAEIRQRLWARARDMARAGSFVLAGWRAKLSPPQRAALLEIDDELNQAADAADARAAEEDAAGPGSGDASAGAGAPSTREPVSGAPAAQPERELA